MLRCRCARSDRDEDKLTRDRSRRALVVLRRNDKISSPPMVSGPERERAADDRRDGQNAEITSVERVRGLRVQKEDFVLADDPATLPGRERTASAVALARRRPRRRRS